LDTRFDTFILDHSLVVIIHYDATMDKIAAVVLVAGVGSRMLPLTLDMPKPMLRIGGRNLIELKLELLPNEVSEIVLVIGYLGEKIRNYFGDVWNGKRISYVTQAVPNGTAGALWAAKDVLPDRFIVMMGDDLYVEEDIKEMLRYEYAIAVSEVKDREISGGVVLDTNGKFVNVDESKRYVDIGFINTGLYMLSKTIFDHEPVPKSPGSDELGLPQTLALVAKEAPVEVVMSKGWFQVTEPVDLKRGETFLNNQKTA
jgi:NDP-sugar pyrophosphorylase family protein